MSRHCWPPGRAPGHLIRGSATCRAETGAGPDHTARQARCCFQEQGINTLPGSLSQTRRKAAMARRIPKYL